MTGLDQRRTAASERSRGKRAPETYACTEMSCRKSMGITSDNVCLGRAALKAGRDDGRTQREEKV